jgi:hypothetical protein
MLLTLTQITLVILIGVYAMRTASVIFIREPFDPLMIVAAAAFVFSILVFHQPPTTSGKWSISIVVLCTIGCVANIFLFLKPDKTHSDPTNMTFSAISVVGWAIVGIYAALITLNITSVI